VWCCEVEGILGISNACIIIEAAATYSQFLPARYFLLNGTRKGTITRFWSHLNMLAAYCIDTDIFEAIVAINNDDKILCFSGSIMLQCEFYKIRYYSVKKPFPSRVAVDGLSFYYNIVRSVSRLAH
jgi:hypothetical protein